MMTEDEKPEKERAKGPKGKRGGPTLVASKVNNRVDNN